MKKYLIALSFLISSSTVLANLSITLPTDQISTYIPTPILISLPSNSSNFDLRLTSGASQVLNIKSTGAIAVSKISTRFRAVDKSINVSLKGNSPASGEASGTLTLKDVIKPPFDAADEKVLIGPTEYIFVKGSKELLQKSTGGNIRFFVKNAVSQSSYIKKVDIELSKGSEKTILTIYGSPLWWHPFISIDGDFTDSRILDIQMN